MLQHTDGDYKTEVQLGHLRDGWICDAQPHLSTPTDTELPCQGSCDDPRKEVSNRGQGQYLSCVSPAAGDGQPAHHAAVAPV